LDVRHKPLLWPQIERLVRFEQPRFMVGNPGKALRWFLLSFRVMAHYRHIPNLRNIGQPGCSILLRKATSRLFKVQSLPPREFFIDHNPQSVDKRAAEEHGYLFCSWSKMMGSTLPNREERHREVNYALAAP
jgi:hypothetical protein